MQISKAEIHPDSVKISKYFISFCISSVDTFSNNNIHHIVHHCDRQRRGDNYLNVDPRTRFRPISPFGVSLDDINSSPLQLCVDYAPLNSLCLSGLYINLSDI